MRLLLIVFEVLDLFDIKLFRIFQYFLCLNVSNGLYRLWSWVENLPVSTRGITRISPVIQQKLCRKQFIKFFSRRRLLKPLYGGKGEIQGGSALITLESPLSLVARSWTFAVACVHGLTVGAVLRP